MKIQVIRFSTNAETITDGIVYSPLTKPRALDDFDINIIDLSVIGMWRYPKSSNFGLTSSNADLLTIRKMVDSKRRAIVIYVMPQNISYYHYTNNPHSQTVTPIKNNLPDFHASTISSAIPKNSEMVPIVFENTRTTLKGFEYEADFYLPADHDIITASDHSEKPTTIKISPETYATTLDVTKTSAALKHFIHSLFVKQNHEDAPSWISDINFNDDEAQASIIKQSNADIEAAKAKIFAAEAKLKENARYKSILYTNGDELVDVVFDILEKLLNYDLSQFEDKKKEDFLVKTTACTFIGEIKGVTSNVKFEHISQVELHYRSYLDTLEENGKTETVKQLLIMNPFRTKPLSSRDPVHTSQIELATRNGCLIIETKTLLRLFEKFCSGSVSAEQCIQVFSNKIGLLNISDFDTTEDLTLYKI